MPHTRPEECLQAAVDALGGAKIAGQQVRPDMNPVDAGKWVNRCLNEDHAQRFDYGQEAHIYRLACLAGEHEAFTMYAESIGYRVEPINRTAEILALAQRAEKRAAEAGELTERARALMVASGLKVDA